MAIRPSTSSGGCAGPRHIEIQLLGDRYGTILPFVERECSIQRRHQKVVEESPSLAVDAHLRRRAGGCGGGGRRARAATAAPAPSSSCSTTDGAFYFLEMNTRLQVEHPVTEMVTSIDLVQWQIRIARGERLTIDPARAQTPQGHAIECRIYAEDPDEGFLPSPGLVRGLRPASGPGIRDDGGVAAGYTVPVFYDSMIAKLVAWADSRTEAIARMARALREYEVLGVKTTIPFFIWLMRKPDFVGRPVRYDLPRSAAGCERSGEPFTPDRGGRESPCDCSGGGCVAPRQPIASRQRRRRRRPGRARRARTRCGPSPCCAAERPCLPLPRRGPRREADAARRSRPARAGARDDLRDRAQRPRPPGID